MEDYQAGSERGPEERKRPWWKTDWEKLNIWQVVQISGLLLVILFISFIVWGFILAGPSGFLWSKTELKPLIVTTSLTTTGGVGAVALMVINYQKQKYTEHQFELETTKFSEEQLAQEKLDYARYVEMLSKENPAVVLSGIQGISNYADTLALRNDLRAEEAKKECASILCALIRSEGNAPESRRNNAAQNQFEALRVIKSHLLDPESPTSWMNSDFDLHEVNFWCPVHLEQTHFTGSLDLWSSVFHRSVSTASAHFNNVSFNNTTFKELVDFSYATFTQDINFHNATFTQNTYLPYATFMQNTYFLETTFTQDAYFNNTTFTQNTYFLKCAFAQDAHFNNTIFTQNGIFNSTTFSCADFNEARFQKDAYFTKISFDKSLHFTQIIAKNKFLLNDINSHQGKVSLKEASFGQLVLEGSTFIPISDENSYAITGDEEDFSRAHIRELREKTPNNTTPTES